MSALLSHRRELGERLEFSRAWLENPSLSRSLLIGLLMLAAFPPDGSYIGNATLAKALDLNSSTCHRYLSTLLEIGLVDRDPYTRLYRLPPTGRPARAIRAREAAGRRECSSGKQAPL